jgi:hypothetical protein
MTGLTPSLAFYRACGLAIIAVLVAACGILGLDDPCAFNQDGEEAVWSTMDRVMACAMPNYEVVDVNDELVDIVVESKDPEFIAGAMAHAWNRFFAGDVIGVVRAFSDSPDGEDFDRGMLSEGRLGDRLEFQVCSTYLGTRGREFCDMPIEFTVPQ